MECKRTGVFEVEVWVSVYFTIIIIISLCIAIIQLMVRKTIFNQSVYSTRQFVDIIRM